MLNFIQNNQIASTVVAGLILAFILWLIVRIWNRVRIFIASSKPIKTSTDIGVDQNSTEEKSLEKPLKKEESFDLNPLQNRILLEFSEIGTELRIRHLMEIHEIRKTDVGFHIDTLIKYDLLHHGGHSGDGSYYYVTPKGREYLMKIRKRRER